MKDSQRNKDTKKQRTNTLQNNSAVLSHQIDKKVIKTVGNINRNGVPLTTTATTSSSAKISLTSNNIGKSVVSSVSMSLERKDSIHYMPRQIAPCTVPAGQNTVVHLDNYTHFMAQRVTTTKTAFKRAEIVSEDQNSNITPCSTNMKSSEITDVDLNVLVSGVDSSFHINKKTLNMNKQKLQDGNPATPTKLRGRKSSLVLEHKKPMKLKVKIKKDVLCTSTPSKPVAKKPNKPGRKQIIKPRQPKKPKKKVESSAMQDIVNAKSDKDDLQKLVSPFVMAKGEHKILRPCTYTLQSKKCLNEMTCPYLHSDFPCKYYYLNIPCPQDFRCQFMHNGPLEPKLKEALRSHILDLLSTKPSAVETHFVQQIHYIDDLSHRLQYFQLIQDPNNEIIEVVDDVDEDQILVIDESSNDISANNNTLNANTLPNFYQETDEMQPQYSIDKLDMIYEKFKETNYAVEEIDKKLKGLKTTLNISPIEKIHQLQVIYDLLKEQEKRLEIYENATSSTQMTVCDKEKNSALNLPSLVEKPNIILESPNIVNDICTEQSQENMATAIGEENSVAAIHLDEPLGTELPILEGTAFLANEEENFIISSDEENNASAAENEAISANDNVPLRIEDKEETMTNSVVEHTSNDPHESSIEVMSIEEIPAVNSKSNDDDELKNLNRSLEKDNENANDLTENCAITDHRNDVIEIGNVSFEKQTFETNLENDCAIVNGKSFEQFDNNEMAQLSNIKIPIEETLAVAITNGEKIIENNIKDTRHQDVEEHSPSHEQISPSKPIKRSRIRLRSHRLQDYDEINKTICESLPASEPAKPIRARRLRLPKPSPKPAERSLIDECQINAEVINKLIKSSEGEPVQNEQIPTTQNVILTNRFLKKTKNKSDQSSQLTKPESNLDINVDQNMCSSHTSMNKDPNAFENIDVSLLTQTSDDNYSSNTSGDKLIVAGDDSSFGESCVNLPETTFSENLNLSEDKDNIEIKNQDLKRRISFETLPNVSSVCVKEKYNLGNLQVVLTKTKIPSLPQTIENSKQTESITSYANPIVPSSSSSSLLADDKLVQKRRNLHEEADMDSPVRENKCLKLDNSHSVKLHNREFNPKRESNHLMDEDNFDAHSNDGKLTKTPSCNSMQQQEGSSTPSSSTHQEKQQQDQHPTHHEYDEHKEQTENESDLRQQIENISNKSDLQLQIQQQEQERVQQQQKEVERTANTTAAIVTRNICNLPHKQNKQQKNVVVMAAANEDDKDLLQHRQYEEGKPKGKEIANTCNSYDKIEKDEDEHTQSVLFKCIYEPEKLTSNSSNKYSNEISVTEKEINFKYSTYSSLFNKLTTNSKKRQINFENSSVNITPISSPTYGNDDDTIKSPSPIRKLIDFRMGGEIDGRLTYPPIPYIYSPDDWLYEIDLGKIEVNKPLYVDKLKRTIQLDPRVFRNRIKKKSMKVCKPIETAFNALVPLPSTSSMRSLYDPRNRSSDTMADITTSLLPQQTALTPYNSMQTAVVPSSSSSAAFMQTAIPDAVPLALQYHRTSQPILQPQQQQTPNMFLYGCLQRSPWYQSLMSTMKIQINQSISQLVRTLNNFHRERVFNPELVFDVFKIDCAGELLEIMRNLGIFVDANGIINEQRQVPSFAGHTCCNNAPVNAAYSFIQQYLTPNGHCTALASHNTAASGPNHHCQLNANEPFVSCYVKAPEPPQKHSRGCCCCSAAEHSHNDDTNCNRISNSRNDGDNSRSDNNNNNSGNYSGKRYNNNNNNQFKKPYDNDSTNNYQQRSNQRSSYNNYNNNPRFMKPGAYSPSKSNSSPSSSPKRGSDGGSYGGRGGRGGGGGGGGRFNNNKRFNNYNKDNDWFSSGSNDNNFKTNKYQNSNSPPRSSSPNLGSPPKALPPKTQKSDEESWD